MRRAAAAALVALLVSPACSAGMSGDGAGDTAAGDVRIVTLTAGLTEVVFALGLGDHVVARDLSSTLDAASHLPIVTNEHEVNPEAVLAVSPTVVLVDDQTGPASAIEQLREVGVRVEVVPAATRVDQIGTRLREVGEVLGAAERAETLAAQIEREIEAMGTPSAAGAVRVAFLYVRGPAGVYLMGGPGSGPDSLIAAAGAIDAGTDIGLERAFTPLTPEAMVEAAPDVILLTTTGLDSVSGIDGLLKLSGVAQTPAGRAKRIITAEDGLLFSFGPRTPALIDVLRSEIDRLMADGGGGDA